MQGALLSATILGIVTKKVRKEKNVSIKQILPSDKEDGGSDRHLRQHSEDQEVPHLTLKNPAMLLGSTASMTSGWCETLRQDHRAGVCARRCVSRRQDLESLNKAQD
jgi:hypothetical protein